MKKIYFALMLILLSIGGIFYIVYKLNHKPAVYIYQNENDIFSYVNTIYSDQTEQIHNAMKIISSSKVVDYTLYEQPQYLLVYDSNSTSKTPIPPMLVYVWVEEENIYIIFDDVSSYNRSVLRIVEEYSIVQLEELLSM